LPGAPPIARKIKIITDLTEAGWINIDFTVERLTDKLTGEILFVRDDTNVGGAVAMREMWNSRDPLRALSHGLEHLSYSNPGKHRLQNAAVMRVRKALHVTVQPAVQLSPTRIRVNQFLVNGPRSFVVLSAEHSIRLPMAIL